MLEFLVHITVLIDMRICMRVYTFYYLSDDEYSKLMLDDLQALLTSNAKVKQKRNFLRMSKFVFTDYTHMYIHFNYHANLNVKSDGIVRLDF